MAVDGKAGRNDPCPCGSGKKHKRCCLGAEVEVDGQWHRMRRAEGVVVNAVLDHIRTRYGWDLVDEAWAEFRGLEAREPTPADEAEFEQLFIPWLVFNWTPDPDDPETPADWPEKPLALACLEQKPTRFDAFARRFLEAACARPYSFYAITRVERGGSLGLRDVITGREFDVLERQATAHAEPGLLLFTRVVPLDGVAIMVGSAPLAIPPTYRLPLIELREDMAGGAIPDESALHDWDIELRETYLQIKDEVHHPRLPELRNTDGEPLLPTTLQFALACSPRAAFERLKSLALDAPDEELLADSACDPAGELREVHFGWLKRGNAQHRSWDNTVMGTIAIKAGALVVEVNSERRAREIRAEVEKRLGDLAVLRSTVTEPVEPRLEAAHQDGSAAERGRNGRVEESPEIREALRRFTAEHWESWIDEKIPALRFETPREAARSPEGRERLEALLAQFEWQGRRAAQPELRSDVAALRARLGL